jgi:3-methyl-2-oxobutanoate hydroxymethyltransferase
MAEQRKPVTTARLRKMKEKGEKIAMVTAYDYPSALLAEEAGADVILVGDSLGMVVLGYESTIPVTLDDMVHHTKAVTRAARTSLVVSDLPFLTYHGGIDATLSAAGRLMQEGLAKAVKLEGGAELAPTIRTLVRAGVPVAGHIGLTPQSVYRLGGFRVQGRTVEQARRLLDDALALEEAGAFLIVLEMVPEELAAHITERLTVPTIGIGAGRGTDGQVLVYHDLLQYASPLDARFVKSYADLGAVVRDGIAAYVRDVKSGAFPEEQHVFHLEPDVLDRLKNDKEDTP